MNIKTTAIGVVIFAAGAGTGYFVCKKRMVVQYKEDLIDIKDFYNEKLEAMGLMEEGFNPSDLWEPSDIDETEEEDDEPEQYEETEEDDTNAEYNAKVLRYSGALRTDPEGKGKPIIKYNKPPLQMEDWGDLEPDEEEPDEDDIDLEYEAELERMADEMSTRRFENKTNGLPYVIDYDEYENGPDEYDNQVLYYYSKDRTLCEDDDSEVEDEEGAIGFDYEDVLDMQTTAWVINDTLMTLYEIHRIDESYKIAVQGVLENPREREFRLLGRRKQAMDD
jgi:hypothetical protein